MTVLYFKKKLKYFVFGYIIEQKIRFWYCMRWISTHIKTYYPNQKYEGDNQENSLLFCCYRPHFEFENPKDTLSWVDNERLPSLKG